MQRFEVAIPRDKVSETTRALAGIGIVTVAVQALDTQNSSRTTARAHSDAHAMQPTRPREVVLEFFVGDEKSQETFETLARITGTARISRYPSGDNVAHRRGVPG